MGFQKKRLGVKRDSIAPDGSDVRLLLRIEEKGNMAHFELPPGQVSTAVTHRTVEEIWFFLTGRGEMWRKQNGGEKIVPVEPGVCLTIPLGTHFQFRSYGYEPLAAIGIAMPPWPEDEEKAKEEAYPVDGKWKATVPIVT